MKKIIRWMEIAGWTVNRRETNANICYEISKLTPARGDDYIVIEIKEDREDLFIQELKGWIRSYDISEETYIWLDGFGHGENGAPYDMMDVYMDKKAFLGVAEKLLDELEKLVEFLIEEKDGDNIEA